jgi:hypothetical protein
LFEKLLKLKVFPQQSNFKVLKVKTALDQHFQIIHHKMVKSKKGDHKAKINNYTFPGEDVSMCEWLLEFVDTSHTLTPGESHGNFNHLITSCKI